MFTIAGAFFVPATMLDGGLRMDFFGSAGAFVPVRQPCVVRHPSLLGGSRWRILVSTKELHNDKIVPDPPLVTQSSPTFGSCNGSHDPLFAVRAGVSSEDALIHASVLLKSAYQTNAHACDMVNAEVRGLLWATEQSLEMSIALVEALLDEVEARSATAAVLRRAVRADQAAVK